MQPRIVTTWTKMRDHIAGAPAWLKTYGVPGTKLYAAVESLIALERPTPETALACYAEVPGHDGRYLSRCDGCEHDVPIVVVVGEPLDWESSTAILCPDCARASVAALEAALGEGVSVAATAVALGVGR